MIVWHVMSEELKTQSAWRIAHGVLVEEMRIEELRIPEFLNSSIPQFSKGSR